MICAACSTQFGSFGYHGQIKNGEVVCNVCKMKLGFFLTMDSKYNRKRDEELLSYTKEDCIARIDNVNSIISEKSQFKVTKQGVRLFIDESSEKFYFNGKKTYYSNSIHRFEDLIGYEILQNETVVSSGGLGSAVVGGLLFGGAGAIVGAVTGTKRSTGIISKIHIRLNLDSMSSPVEYVDYLDTRMGDQEVKENSRLHDNLKQDLDKDTALLELILRKVQISKENNQVNSIKLDSVSTSKDRLEKIRNLFESGLIDEVEYQKKRSEIIDGI